jgi:hypothetical protein
MSTPSTSHGHVTPRPDGVKARCGGPAWCTVCQREQAALTTGVSPSVPAEVGEADADLRHAAFHFFAWFNRHYPRPSEHPEHEWNRLDMALFATPSHEAREPAQGEEKLTRFGTYVDGKWVGSDWSPAPEPTTADTSPIARIKVDEDGKIIDATLYAPGLPSGEHDVWPVRVTLTEEDEALMKAAESLKRAADKCDAEHTATIIQRDLYHDIADELAERIARITGVEIGEHSSNNDPWMRAKYAADEHLQLLPQPPKPSDSGLAPTESNTLASPPPLEAGKAVPEGWAVEAGEGGFSDDRWVCVRHLESQCGQDFYESNNRLIFNFLMKLASTTVSTKEDANGG